MMFIVKILKRVLNYDKNEKWTLPDLLTITIIVWGEMDETINNNKYSINPLIPIP